MHSCFSLLLPNRGLLFAHPTLPSNESSAAFECLLLFRGSLGSRITPVLCSRHHYHGRKPLCSNQRFTRPHSKKSPPSPPSDALNPCTFFFPFHPRHVSSSRNPRSVKRCRIWIVATPGQ